jgi:diguanylate cyclase (GGDEF)-like protein
MPENTGEESISEELALACAEEPIHLIGTVQPHGFLLVVDLDTLRIVQVSSGIARHWDGLGEAARMLQAPITDWLEGVLPDARRQLASLSYSAASVLPLRPRRPVTPDRVRPTCSRSGDFECVGHRVGRYAVLEWQPPLAMQGAPAQLEGMAEMRSAIARLRSPKLLEAFFQECVSEVHRICGFDRVMLYRFLPDWSGEVIAEKATAKLKTRFVGLRFPATDIPAQARALYVTSKIRVLADVDAVPDTLLPGRLPDGIALDQSQCLLRGFSEVHRTYLRNMGVRATMSLSIVSDDKLWGLIACHHYEPRTASVAIRNPLRELCELVAEVVALRVESLSQLESTQNKLLLEHLLNELHHALLLEENITVVLDLLLPQLLHAFDADGFYASIGKVRYAGARNGSIPPGRELFAELARRFAAIPEPATVLQRTDLLTPQGTPFATLPMAAGMLAAHQFGEGLELCAFTRPEVAREIHWAGMPAKRLAISPQGRVRLEPRRSFELWKENAAGTARDWSRIESDACERLLRILSDKNKRQLHMELQQVLEWRAHHDHLTGLFNRRTFEEHLNERLARKNYDLALMLIDMDHFKSINDTKGHAVGDRLLKEFAQRLESVILTSDTLARVGGDEFMLLANMSTPPQTTAVTLANRLHAAMLAPFDVDGQWINLGISVGIAIPPGHGTNPTDLMRRADLAMYQAKKLGRSRTVVFDAELELALLGAYEVERDLRDAIANDQLALVFQPEVDLRTGRVVGLEALIRWQHPTQGAIGPSIFIPIAERSDLIGQIGQWVVRKAVATQAAWHAQGQRALPVAINVSMAEVTSGTLVDHIDRTLREYHMPAQCLGVELTESVIMSDPGLALEVLTGLRRLGISTALDDFGTGYSSLSYLRQLPLTCLKVDQSFTSALTGDAQSQGLVHAIIRMADALKMTTIAEGVENRGQLRWLMAHDCGIGQGNFFSHPVPAAAVHTTVARIEASWQGLH